MHYFAYGSNINPARLLDRKVEYISRKKGILQNYILVFNKRAKRNPKEGYANVIQSTNSIVEGALYEVAEKDILKLDKYEGYPKHYSKQTVSINVGGVNLDAIVYVATSDFLGEGLKPTQEYLNHILAGRDIFSIEYYQLLCKTRTLDDSL